jgi:hypothetical protein
LKGFLTAGGILHRGQQEIAIGQEDFGVRVVRVEGEGRIRVKMEIRDRPGAVAAELQFNLNLIGIAMVDRVDDADTHRLLLEGEVLIDGCSTTSGIGERSELIVAIGEEQG